MAKPEEQPSLAKTNPSKSYSAILCKSLFIAFLVVVLPLFPSQAPEFINQIAVLTKLWELLHLLFIGIAVSYGLFGRKNAEIDIEIQPKLDDTQTYLSGILHISSIFENGCENPYGSDEKRMIQIRKSGFSEKEWERPRSLISLKDLEIPSFDEKNAVFAQESCVLDEWDEKPKPNFDYKPLGLPVRSLRSRIVDQESVKGNGSSLESKSFCMNSDKIRNGKFRGLTPINLEEKFKETVSLPSPIPWGSRSSRMEVREDVSSDFLSVGESESVYLNSQSFWSPIFSQTSPIPSPTISKQIPDSKLEDLGKSASTFGNGEASSVSTKARGLSIGSSSEMNVKRDCEGNLKDFSSRSMREDPLGKGKWGVDSWKIEGKPKSPVKQFARGKSVRTIRASEIALEDRKMGKICSDQVEDNVGKKTNCAKIEGRKNLDGFSLEESSKISKHQNGEKEDFVETNGVESEKESESEFEKFQVSSDEEEEQEAAKCDISNGGELDPDEVDRKADEFIAKFQESSDEEGEQEAAKCDISNGGELDPDEVDRKADEFIAKFREQIRLQKVASVKGFSGR